MGLNKRAKTGNTANPEQALGQGGEHLKSLLDLSTDWYWEQDEHHRFTQITGRAFGKAGFNAQENLGTARWDRGGWPVGDGGSWDPHQATLKARQPFTDFLFKRPNPHGELRYISSSGEPVFDNQGRFRGYCGIARDVTERVQMELRFTIEHGVTRVLAESSSIAEAAPQIIRVIYETLGGSCGARWVPDERGEAIRCAETWGVASAEIDAFLEATRRQAPSTQRGGLNRRAWVQGEPLWIRDVTKEATFRRAPDALNAGLRSAFAFPIKVGAQLIGVMEFFSREIHQPDAELLNGTRYIGSQIGQFMQRKQAEAALHESVARFRSLTNLSSDWFWEQNAEFRFTKFSGAGLGETGMDAADLIGKTHWEVPGLVVDSAAQAAVQAKMDAREPFHDLEYQHMESDGSSRYITTSGTPIFDASSRFTGYRGIAKDITARKHDERLLTLEHAVNRCLADADNISAALKSVMCAVCETQSWECGRYLRIDERAGVLRFGEAWNVPSAEIERYIEESRGMVYGPGVGVVGRVWQSGQPLWVADIGQDARVARTTLARETGMHGAFAVAVLSEGKTIGVLIFHSREVRKPDERLLQAMRVIGNQIGQFLQRKHAERATLRLGKMFAALSATNDAILHAESPEELYQQVCDATVHGGKFSNTTIFLAEPGASRVKAVASAGRVPQQLRASHISIDETIPEGRGLVGEAFRTQRLCVSNDFLNDERTRPWHEIGRQEGFRSAAALPLIQGGRSVGVVLIHYDELNAFDDEIIKLLERMAENVSFALDNFEHEAERRQAQERIQYLATHDGLTELPNRVMFSQMLNLAIQSARRYQRHFAVLFLDLDRFKLINDTLGHEAGDTLLHEMARRIKESLRSSDVVARLGGDEFVVLVQEVNELEQVATVARKLLSTVIKPVVIREQECRVTASIGISMYPTDGDDEQALMKNADVAMYLAKEQGKNNFQFYSKDIKTQSLERLMMETSLRRALECDEFFLHYQAKLDLTTGAITGVEALVRWQHPDLGMVPPLQFIPLAEETGLIMPIGRWVLKTACAQNVAWQRAGLPPVCLAVNLSPRQFNDENLLHNLAAVLQETGMAPEFLELEITESMMMGNIERAVKQLTAIKQMGVRLAIDDFGTGYSSLAQIKRFPIDTIKVDRSFIREIPHDAEDKAITEAIIAMGKSLSLTVVAEGVETQEQQTFLCEHACDAMQGYYFSKPVAPDQFAELLRTHVPNPSPQK